MTIAIVLIPSDGSKPLETHHVSWDTKRNVNSAPFASKVHNRILSLLHNDNDGEDNDGDSDSDDGEYNDLAAIDDRVEVPLLRPLRDSPGLYAYFCSGATATTMPNIRATRLAMACGLMSLRFGGNVVVARSNASGRPRWFDVTTENIQAACGISPDLRPNIQNEIATVDCIVLPENGEQLSTIPQWIKNAAEQNYHDAAAVARMVDVMKSEEKYEDDSESDQSDDDDDDDGSDNSGDDDNGRDNDSDESNRERIPVSNECSATKESFTVTAKSPLCLHCRRPTNNLCEGCGGAYFCPQPRNCITLGWSHSCQCRTWKSYVSHREQLSVFEYLDPEWQSPLVGREFQLSEEPYKRFLTSRLMINKRSMEPNDKGSSDTSVDHKDDSCSPSFSSWWRTETDGWAGGESVSAQEVDITVRRSYEEGFAPIPSDQLPPSQRVCYRDYERSGLSEKANPKNAVGLWRLSTWEEYYRLRSIPAQSPVALLCTFPLTIYRAIVEYGEVPVTVARMLQRPLRIHVVGTEKELNFLDLFQELGFLLPEDLNVELVFVAREDMLPKKVRTIKLGNGGGSSKGGNFLLKVEMTSNLTVGVVGGTYGQTTNSGRPTTTDCNTSTTATSLDPNFDCGSGPPDMVIAMNAGLYAYESWRSVVDYLYHHKGVVGVFTDYNEYSGVHCAGLGGSSSRESLCINPFRQPLAMPVYSMNLPQFSNGFFYVFNAQELD